MRHTQTAASDKICRFGELTPAVSGRQIHILMADYPNHAEKRLLNAAFDFARDAMEKYDPSHDMHHGTRPRTWLLLADPY
jgi:hypothetical protein